MMRGRVHSRPAFDELQHLLSNRVLRQRYFGYAGAICRWRNGRDPGSGVRSGFDHGRENGRYSPAVIWAGRKVPVPQTGLLVPPDSVLFRKGPVRLWRRRYSEMRRLPLVSFGLLCLIVVLALPFFLMVPRTASSALKRSGGPVSGMIGFSDNVTLGAIGELKRNDEIVMHVRVADTNAETTTGLRWRGVALDQFTGKSWLKSIEASRFEDKTDERGLFKLGTTADLSRLTTQTFFLEPIDTPILFSAPIIVAFQGRLPLVRMDAEGSIQTRPHEDEKVVYKV